MTDDASPEEALDEIATQYQDHTGTLPQ